MHLSDVGIIIQSGNACLNYATHLHLFIQELYLMELLKTKLRCLVCFNIFGVKTFLLGSFWIVIRAILTSQTTMADRAKDTPH